MKNFFFPILLFRLSAVLGYVLLACVFPEVGERRFEFAAFACFVVVPGLLAVERFVPVDRLSFSQPIFDVIACSIGVHLLPEQWMTIFMVGLLASNSRLIGATPAGLRCLVSAHLLLMLGMLVAAVVHDVPGWQIPWLAVLCSLPAVLFYGHRFAAELESQAKAKYQLGNLAAVSQGVAHDFNNLLTGLLVNAELAQNELSEDHPASISVRMVSSAANRARMLTQQLQFLTGKQTPLDTVVHLPSETASLVRLLSAMIPDDCEVELRSEDDFPATLADRTRLNQVLMNLILNAAQASDHKRNKIVVAMSFALTKEDAKTGFVRIEISDQGRGIPASDLSRVYEPFFTSKSKGTGIGLSNAKRIVDDLDGTLVLESKVGHGTKAIVRLPMALANKDQAKLQPTSIG